MWKSVQSKTCCLFSSWLPSLAWIPSPATPKLLLPCWNSNPSFNHPLSFGRAPGFTYMYETREFCLVFSVLVTETKHKRPEGRAVNVFVSFQTDERRGSYCIRRAGKQESRTPSARSLQWLTQQEEYPLRKMPAAPWARPSASLRPEKRAGQRRRRFQGFVYGILACGGPQPAGTSFNCWSLLRKDYTLGNWERLTI